MPQIDSNDIPFNESALRDSGTVDRNIDHIVENLLGNEPRHRSNRSAHARSDNNLTIFIGVIFLVVFILLIMSIKAKISSQKLNDKQSEVQNSFSNIPPQPKQWKYFESGSWHVFEGDVPPWSNRPSFTHTVMLKSGQEDVDLLNVMRDDYIQIDVKNENTVPISYLFRDLAGGIGWRIDGNHFIMHISGAPEQGQMMYVSRDTRYAGDVEITFTVYRNMPLSKETTSQNQTSLTESENNLDVGDQMTTTTTENIQQEPFPKPQISLSSYELDFGEVKVRRYGNRIYGYDNRILTISNTGDGDLEIKEVIRPSLPFEIVQNNCLRTIVPNGRCEIVVRFSPYMKYLEANSAYSYKDTFKDKIELHTNEGISKVSLLGQSEYEQISQRYYRFPSRYGNRSIYFRRIRPY